MDASYIIDKLVNGDFIIIPIIFLYLSYVMWSKKLSIEKINKKLLNLLSLLCIIFFVISTFLMIKNGMQNSIEGDKIQITKLINQEAKIAFSKNEDKWYQLRALFTEDIVIIDMKDTPDNAMDDTIYDTWEKIYLRYIQIDKLNWNNVIFPKINIEFINSKEAKVEIKGSIINNKVTKEHSIYQLVKYDGIWLIKEFIYYTDK